MCISLRVYILIWDWREWTLWRPEKMGLHYIFNELLDNYLQIENKYK